MLHQPCLLISQQRQLQLVHDRQGDFILNGKNVFHLTIILFRPEVIAIRDVHQLHPGTKPRSDLLDTAFKHRGHTQRLPDFTDVLLLALEEKGRGPGRNLQLPDIAQPVDNFLCNPIAEPFLVLLGTQIFKRQDCERWLFLEQKGFVLSWEEATKGWLQ